MQYEIGERIQCPKCGEEFIVHPNDCETDYETWITTIPCNYCQKEIEIAYDV